MGLGQSCLQFVCFPWVMAGFLPSVGSCSCGTSKRSCLGKFLWCFFFKWTLLISEEPFPRSQRCLSGLFSPNVQFWTKISFSCIVTRPTKRSETHLVVTSAHQMLLGGCFSLPSISWCQQSSCLLSLSLFNVFIGKQKQKGHTTFHKVLLSGSRKWKISSSCLHPELFWTWRTTEIFVPSLKQCYPLYNSSSVNVKNKKEKGLDQQSIHFKYI